MYRASSRRLTAGFTLVELLVVIIIIAILAGILIPTVNAARRRVLIARVVIEMKQLETAIEQYKTDHGGDYPPDFTDYPVGANPNSKSVNLAAHLARAYPRHNRANITKWMISQPTTQQPGNLDAAEALVFWLSMLRNDVVNPLTDAAGNTITLQPTGGKAYFDFDVTRLKDRDNDGWPEYYPKGVDDAPFVYFHNKTYGGAYYPTAVGGTAIGTARPYAQTITNNVPTFFNPTKFQLLAAGLDNTFGLDTVVNPPNQYKLAPSAGAPEGLNLSKADFDDLGNFSEGKTIEGMKP